MGATILMPADAPASKRAATEGFREVQVHGSLRVLQRP